MDEEARRREAIAALRRGEVPSAICRRLGRTRQWLAKWRRRFATQGEVALRGRSRAPQHRPRSTAERVVRAVLAARDRLAKRTEQALCESRRAGRGAATP